MNADWYQMRTGSVGVSFNFVGGTNGTLKAQENARKENDDEAHDEEGNGEKAQEKP